MFERLSRRAGASARREYQRLAKQWRRDNRKVFVIVGFVVLLAYFTLALHARDQRIAFYEGVAAGVLIAFFITVYSSPPNWIENYQRGAWRDQRTAHAPMPLHNQGWVVIHDLPRTRSNLDHVLIGPGGVFVIDTKNFSGTAEVRGDTLAISYAPDRAPPI